MKLCLSPLRFFLLCAALTVPALTPPSFASAQDTAATADEPESDLTESAPSEGAPAAEGESADAAEESEPAADAEASEASASDAEATGESAPADAAEATSTPTLEEDLAAEESASEATAVDEGEAGAAAAEAPPREPSRFRGSLFSWQHSLTVNTLAPDAQQTYNPTYYWTFFVQPRFYLDRQNFLVLSAGASIELTNNDISTIERQFLLTDTTLEYRHIESVEGFVFIPSVRVTAPTSLASIAAETILTAGAGLTVVKVFPELASLTFAVTGAYRHTFSASTQRRIFDREDDPYAPTCSAASRQYQAFDCPASPQNTFRDQMIAALTVTVMPIPGLTILTQYAGAWMYRHELPEAENPGVGESSGIPDGSPTHWNNGHYWTLAVGYDVLPWLNLQLGYQGSPGFTPWLKQDGTGIQNPFYYYDSEIYLSATVALDVMVDEIIGDGDDELTPEQLQRRRQGLASRGAGVEF